MSSKNKKTILLVEDEAIIAIAQKKTLEKYGYNVISAKSGEIACDEVSNNYDIDLILMDIDLGKGMDGTEAASAILKTREIPVVFLSSHTEPSIVKKTETITSYGYVVKNSGITVLDASIKMAFKLFDANKQISESEMQQKAMISNISDVVGIIDADGIVKYKSPNIEKHFGWQHQELIGNEIWSMIHPEDLERVKKTVFTLLEKDNCEETMEFRYKCKDGSYKDVELYAVNLRKDSKINGVLLNYHDISKRWEVEEKLHDSEIRYRRLFETSMDGILVLDAETGMIVDVNPFLINLLGYSYDMFMGKTIWDIGVFKDIIGNKEKFLELQKKEYVRYENLPLETADGRVIEVEFVSNVYESAQKKVIQCKIRDMTEHKRVETKVQNALEYAENIVETVREPLVVLDSHLKIITANHSFYDTFKVKPLETIGNYIYDVGNRQWDIPELRILFEEILPQNTVLNDYEVDHNFLNIGRKIILLNARQIFRGDIGSHIILLAMEDITDRKEAEDKIRSLLAEKEIILKEVHHRIKNNMYTIQSLLTLQAGTLKEPSAVTALEDAGSRVQSMMVLYEKLYQSDDFFNISVNSYIPSLIDEIIYGFPECGFVKIEKKIDDFILDVKSLQTLGIIINELLTNIMKYAFTGRSAGIIKVSVTLEGNSVTLIIADNGNGMPESISFENSTGFGMQLVSMLTEQIGGSIKIERGEGTKFILGFNL